jgi:S-formylglutathione hydrolase FrmB
MSDDKGKDIKVAELLDELDKKKEDAGESGGAEDKQAPVEQAGDEKKHVEIEPPSPIIPEESPQNLEESDDDAAALKSADGMPAEDEPTEAPKKKKRSLGRIAVYILLIFVGLRIGICIPSQRLRGPGDAELLMATPPEYEYNGPGEIHCFGSHEQLSGEGVKFLKAFSSEILGQDRDIIVFLPAGYEKLLLPLPLVIVFHGYLDQPLHMGAPVIDTFEYAITTGQMPPSILVFPDMSLGGNAKDNPATPVDDRLGSWAVNSNRGRYHDYIVDELLPWIRKNYPVRDDPYGTALMGFSSGGHTALNLTMKHPDLAMSTITIAGTIDTRYAVNGFRLRPYDPAIYKPIEDDKPRRVVARLGPLGRFTDEWAFWPVFDSDTEPGAVWTEDKPVWTRLRDENPMDFARNEKLDLTGHSFYFVAGKNDSFFYQHHIAPFSDLVVKRGAKVYPDDPIRTGGHSAFFVKKELPEAAKWLGKRLREIDMPASITEKADDDTESAPAATPSGDGADAVDANPAGDEVDTLD